MSEPYQEEVFFEDEMRFGTRTDTKRRWTPKGVRPKMPIKIGYEYMYLYCAICPYKGEIFAMFLPSMEKSSFATFLEHFSHTQQQDGKPTPILMIADGASNHQASLVPQSAQIQLVKLPKACPELNPVERFFQELRTQIANKVFDNLAEAMERVEAVVLQWIEQKQRVRKLTLFPYLRKNTST